MPKGEGTYGSQVGRTQKNERKPYNKGTQAMNPTVRKAYNKTIETKAKYFNKSPEAGDKFFDKLTLEIDYLTRKRNIILAKKYGIKKYLYPSSCSVYG